MCIEIQIVFSLSTDKKRMISSNTHPLLKNNRMENTFHKNSKERCVIHLKWSREDLRNR
jgi:hypothetical protein